MIYLIFLFIMIPFAMISEENYPAQYEQAMQKIKSSEFEAGLLQLETLEKTVPKEDSIYNYIIIQNIEIDIMLEMGLRFRGKYEKALEYGLKALNYLENGGKTYSDLVPFKKPLVIANISSSYFALGQYKKAKEYKDMLYKMYEEQSLPDEFKEQFNFDFIKVGNKNVIGMEFYQELPEDRYSSSFSKVIYHVFNTTPDGENGDKLYRLHVLMFHGEQDFAYLLTLRAETENGTVSQSLYDYTYKEEIDYPQLRKDIIKIVTDFNDMEKRNTEAQSDESE